MHITLGTVTSLVTRPVFAEDIIGNGEHNHACTVLVHLVLTQPASRMDSAQSFQQQSLLLFDSLKSNQT